MVAAERRSPIERYRITDKTGQWGLKSEVGAAISGRVGQGFHTASFRFVETGLPINRVCEDGNCLNIPRNARFDRPGGSVAGKVIGIGCDVTP